MTKERLLRILRDSSKTLEITENLDIINGIGWNDFEKVAETIMHELESDKPTT